MSSFLTRLLFTLSLIAVGGIFAANAQEQTKPSGQTQKPRTSDQGATVRIGSEEVLLDIVARDKKGRPITDLKADEIEVYEDGVKQQINSFRKVEKTDLTEGAGASNDAAGAAPAPWGQGADGIAGHRTPGAPPQLRFGMSIGGRWSANSGPVVALPLSALFEQHGTPAVWVVDQSSGSVALRPVTVARYETDRVVVPKGCTSWSCMSVSVPGHYSHNVKPVKKARIRQGAR